MKRFVLAFLVAGCGGAHHGSTTSEAESFNCRDRSVSYMATFGGGAETGVQMDCKDAGPRIKRWKTDKAGVHKEDTRSIEPATFEKVWTQVDGTGWQNLHDCANGSLGKNDPVYTFDIKDDQNKASFTCQTVEMPYPYNDLTNPLDLAANQGQKQLGDDEPADLKALDEKDKQK
ncbi:MAG TPA: hypothetical protein VGL61_11495 [Kofleriaceae bacterium]|jgi:hypothetical protein